MVRGEAAVDCIQPLLCCYMLIVYSQVPEKTESKLPAEIKSKENSVGSERGLETETKKISEYVQDV